MTFKTVLFRLHWLAGITAGLVLCVVGGTGAVLALQGPMIELLNPSLHIAPRAEPASPARWIASAERALPGHVAQSVTWRGPARAAEVRLVAPGQGGHGRSVAVDPYSAIALGELRGAAFFAATQKLHRELLAGSRGKQLVGASTLLLVVMLASGLVLRWPARASLRTWLVPRVATPGRPRWWSLHAVFGTWLLPVYLILALTGLTWSYPAYRAWIAESVGAADLVRARGAGGPPPAPVAVDPAVLDRALAALLREAPRTERAQLALPRAAGAPLEWRYLAEDAPHDRAMDKLRLDARGAVVAREPWRAQPRGHRLVGSFYALHTGSWFGSAGPLVYGLASFALPLFAATGLWMWALRRRRSRRALPVDDARDAAAATT